MKIRTLKLIDSKQLLLTYLHAMDYSDWGYLDIVYIILLIFSFSFAFVTAKNHKI